MSREYEAQILVGESLDFMWSKLTPEFKEKEELADMYDYRDYLWSFDDELVNTCDTCNFIGYQATKTSETIRIADMLMFAELTKSLAKQFKQLTGFDAEVTAVVYSY